MLCHLLLQLVVSWHMKAATMCEFSKQEFIGGLQSLGLVYKFSVCPVVSFTLKKYKSIAWNCFYVTLV